VAYSCCQKYITHRHAGSKYPLSAYINRRGSMDSDYHRNSRALRYANIASRAMNDPIPHKNRSPIARNAQVSNGDRVDHNEDRMLCSISAHEDSADNSNHRRARNSTQRAGQVDERRCGRSISINDDEWRITETIQRFERGLLSPLRWPAEFPETLGLRVLPLRLSFFRKK